MDMWRHLGISCSDRGLQKKDRNIAVQSVTLKTQNNFYIQTGKKLPMQVLLIYTHIETCAILQVTAIYESNLCHSANNAKHSKPKLAWFSRFLRHSARKRGGLILQHSWAHTGPEYRLKLTGNNNKNTNDICDEVITQKSDQHLPELRSLQAGSLKHYQWT